jgi:hypothetical protein
MKARYLLLALAALSCAEPSAPAPQGDLFPGWPLPPPQPTGLRACTPVAADSATQTIGPEGGTLQVGANTLVIPAGALDSAVTITAMAPSDTVNRVQFQPEGLTFNEPARLTMSYANCNTLGLWLPKQIAFTTDDLLLILEYLPSWDNLFGQTVTGHVRHFSDYAIAW